MSFFYVRFLWGLARAQRNLGNMYYNGQGVKQDYKKAVVWYEKAAEQGNVNAQCNLACLYESGNGVEKDTAKAVYWYMQSAEQGNALAQNTLGWRYAAGQGIEKDIKKAVYWFYKSAQQGNSVGQRSLASMYEHGTGVAQNYSAARYWYIQSANQGIEQAQVRLGYMYATGLGVEKNVDIAMYWFSKLTNPDTTAIASMTKFTDVMKQYPELVQADCQRVFGDMFFYGRGVQKDLDIAKIYYEGVDNKDKQIKWNLAIINAAEHMPMIAALVLLLVVMAFYICNDYTDKIRRCGKIMKKIFWLEKANKQGQKETQDRHDFANKTAENTEDAPMN